jgi:hypothetical protein
MSIEAAIITQARPIMLANRIETLFQMEAGKGSQFRIEPVPVALEPPFEPLLVAPRAHPLPVNRDAVLNPEDLVPLEIWIDPRHNLDWFRAERFLKQLQLLHHRAIFQITGNCDRLAFHLIVHRSDQPILQAVFRGELDKSAQVTQARESPFSPVLPEGLSGLVFRDYLPPSPYSHLFTRPEEFHASPLESLLTSFMNLPAEGLGFFQVVFEPVAPDHDWHRNIQTLLDLEYFQKLIGGHHLLLKMAQQGPSGDLRNLAGMLQTKAHPDKPLFAAALRVGYLGVSVESSDRLDSLTGFTGLWRHGGRPLSFLDEREYRAVLSDNQIQAMLTQGLCHRSGFLVNSWELTGLVHLPPLTSVLDRGRPRMAAMSLLDPLVPQRGALAVGTPVGVCDLSGVRQVICIPEDCRSRHLHLLARAGMGKSTTMEHMILHDVAQGQGVAVLDPHGDLVENLLDHLPESAVGRVIYLDPGDPEFVPLWNPLQLIPGQDPGRTADDLVGAFKSIVEGWGDRMENLLRQAFFALLHLPGSTLLEVTELLQSRPEPRDRLRHLVLPLLDNVTAQDFWQYQYANYAKSDFGPPLHKLSKLLVGRTLALMLSQPHSAFSFRRIMDEGQILLVNLAHLGSETRNLLGALILSLLYETALGRSDCLPADRKPFHLFADEVHRFLTGALEDLIIETRKYNVSLTLAHQYLHQFDSRKIDALTCIGSSILYNMDARDAQYLIKDLQGRVTVEDLVNLERGEAIFRCGSEIVRIRTPKPVTPSGPSARRAILENSHRLYYRPIEVVQEWVRRRADRWQSKFNTLGLEPQGNPDFKAEDFTYDEFD